MVAWLFLGSTGDRAFLRLYKLIKMIKFELMETYSMARLPVSKATFNEILKKLIDAGYEGDYAEKDFIDMQRIRLVRQEETSIHPRHYCEKCGTAFCGIIISNNNTQAIEIDCKHKVFSEGAGERTWRCSKCGRFGCDNFHWATSVFRQKCALE